MKRTQENQTNDADYVIHEKQQKYVIIVEIVYTVIIQLLDTKNLIIFVWFIKKITFISVHFFFRNYVSFVCKTRKKT